MRNRTSGRKRWTAGREARAVLALSVLAGLAALTASGAQAASAGLKPSEAPLIEVGQHYFGNTDRGGDESGGLATDFWHLPPLLTADAITIAWHSEGVELCLAQNIDDYSWAEEDNICNGSERYYVASNGSARTVIEAKSATSLGYLEFLGERCCRARPYDFTIESIQHAIGVGLTPVTEITPTSTLTGSANLSNGSPVPDGMAFTLSASWVTPVNKASHSRSYTVTSGGGALAFPLSLPSSAEGKHVSLTVTRPADPQYLAASSPAIEATVAKLAPSPPPRKRHRRRHRHHRRHHHRRHHRLAYFSAQVSNVQQECKRALLALPTVLNEEGSYRTEMFNPGQLRQVVAVSIEYQATPPNCGSFRRIGKGSVELANSRHHNQLTDLGDIRYAGTRNYVGGASLAQNSHTTSDNYQCTPGPGKTPVWLELQNVVKNRAGHVIGKSQARKMIEVEGGGC